MKTGQSITTHRNRSYDVQQNKPGGRRMKRQRRMGIPVFHARGILACGIAVLLALPGMSRAATWTGGSSGDMGIAANWGGTLPTITGDSFIFNAAGAGGAALNNTLTGQVINSGNITFNSAASAYTLTGNALTMGSTVTVAIVNNSANLQTFILPLNLAQSLTASGGSSIILNGAIGQGGTAGARSIRNDMTGGTLTIGGNISLSDGTARVWTLAGTSSANTVITGGIQNGGAGAGALTIYTTNSIGAGGATLSGANTYTGATTVSFGTLKLDFAAAAFSDNILNNVANSSALTLGGGTLNITGKLGATNNQRFNGTTFATSRASAFRITQNGAANVGVTLGGLTRNGGSTVDFTLPTTGSITTTTTTGIGANNIMASSAGVAFGTVDGATWAINTSGTIGALANVAYQTAFTLSTGNTDITTSLTPAAFTTNTLRFNNAGSALTLNSSGSSTVTSGGILVTAAGAGSSIASGGVGAGLAVGAGKELVVINNTTGTSGFTISAPILDNATSALTIAGPGITTLTGVNTYAGTTNLTGGVLDVGLVTGTSLGAGGIVLSGNGVLQGNGLFSRAFSGGATAAAGLITGLEGGFAAKGGTLTLNFGGAGASFQFSAASFRLGNNFVFGSPTADSPVLVVNPLDLNGATNGVARTFTVNSGVGGDYAELQGVVSSATGALIKAGSGLLILSAANTYTGATTITGGILQIGNPATNGGTTGSIDTTSAIVNNATLVLNRTGALTISAVISGTGALNQIGAGTTTLTGTNTFTGQTTINLNSTLQLGSGSTTGSVASTSGILNNGTLIYNRSGTPTSLSYVISGTGAVNVVGTGTITFAAANTYSGPTTITGGVLQLGVGTGGGTAGSINNTSGITNNAALALNRSNALSVPSDISGSGVVNQIGAGVSSLGGTNTYLGGTNINAGTLSFLNTNARPATGITTVAAGATIGLGVASAGSFFTSADVDSLFAGTMPNVTNDPASLVGIDTTAGNFTYGSSVPSTTRGLTKLGANTLSLAGVNSYTGTTNVNAGVLRLDNAGALPGGVTVATGTSALLFTGGILGLTTASGDFTRAIGTATPAVTDVGWASGATGGFAAFGGNRTVNFGDAATPTSVTWSTTGGSLGGGLILSDSSADSTITVLNPIAFNGAARTFIVNDGTPAVDAILGGTLSGTGSSLIKTGGGTLALTGTNTYGSALTAGTTFTTISAGTLQIGNGGITGSLTSSVLGVEIQNDATLAFNRTDLLTMQFVIKGVGAVNQIGTGTTALSGTNTYTGGTNVTAGALSLLNTNAKPASGTITVAAGATLGLGVAAAGSFFTSADVDSLFAGTLPNVANNATSQVGIDTTAGNFTYASSVPATTRGLTKLGTNTLSLTGTNSYTGRTTVIAGILRLDSVGALPGGIGATGGTSNLVMSGGVLGLTAASGDFTRGTGSGASQVRWITDTVSGFAAFGGDRTVNFGGSATPSTVTWSNGGGVLGNGLILSDSTADSTVTVANPIDLNFVANNRVVTVNDGTPAVDAVLAGVISSLITANNGTRLIKNGSGTLALTAANTYVSGSANVGTTISAGTLQLGNGGTTGSISALTGTGINSDVTISTGATFAFNRSNALPVANTITGAGAVRQIGAGTTTLSGTNTYTGATTVTAGTLAVSGSISGSTVLSVTNGVLQMSAPNVFNDAATLNLNNGTLNTGGNSEFAGAGNGTGAGLGALTLAATSTIDFGAGASTLWMSVITGITGSLNITNWSGDPVNGGGTDQLRFTADPSAFLGQISFAGSPGAAQIFFPNGGNSYFEIVPVPEPSSVALIGMAAISALCGFRSRRRQGWASSLHHV